MAPNQKGFIGRLATVIIATGLAVATLLVLAYEGGALHFSKSYTVKAIVPSTSTLIAGASVTMAGADVGRVTSVKQMGNGAEVTMAITNKKVTPIPVNSRVALREVTAVGENYMEIDPGNSGANLQSGGVLPVQQADQYVDVDQIMSVLQGSTQQKTREIIQALGAAVKDNGQNLNTTLGAFNNTVNPVATLVSDLEGQQAKAATLVHDLGQVASAAGARGNAIQTLASSALTSFRSLSSEYTSLSDTLDQLPSTLSATHSAADALNSATNTAVPVVRSLAKTLHDVSPAIQALEPAAADGRRVVSELSATAPGLTATLADAQKLASPTTKSLPQLKTVLCQVNPMLKYIQPYTGDIISFVSWFGSAVNDYDNIGHLVPIVPVVGDDSLNGLPTSTSTALETLLHSGALEDSTSITWDPYPKPGQIGTEHAGDGTPYVSGPAQLNSVTGYTYPHTNASCTA